MTADSLPPLVKAAKTPPGDRVDTGRGTHSYVPAGVMPPGHARVARVLFVVLAFLTGIYAPQIWSYRTDLYAGNTR